MPISSGTRADLIYVEQTNPATVPTSGWKKLRATSRNVNLVKDTLESEEVRSDREITDFRHGFNRVEGSIGAQVGVKDFDDMIRFGLGGTWTGVVASIKTISTATGANRITRATGSFITDGFRPGDIVRLAGTSDSAINVGNILVTAVVASELTVSPPTGVTWSATTGSGDEVLTLDGSNTSVTVINAAITIAATATGFTDSASGFVTGGLNAGDVINVSGFNPATPNGTYVVLTVAAGTITTYPAPGATDAAGDSVTIATRANSGFRMDVGTNLYQFALERRFTDITQYQLFKNLAVNSLQVQIQPSSMVTMTAEVIGLSSVALTGSTASSNGTPTSPSGNSPMSAFDGAIYDNGAAIAVATGLDFTVANNRSVEGVIGSKFSPDIFEGRARVTGTMTFFLTDATLINKFVNETFSKSWTKLNDVNGTDFLNVVMNRISFGGAAIDPPQEGPVPISMPFVALKDETNGFPSISIQRSNR
jgi:hypothetical protein